MKKGWGGNGVGERGGEGEEWDEEGVGDREGGVGGVG